MRLLTQLALIPILATMLVHSQAHTAPASPPKDSPRLSTSKLKGAQFSDEELKSHYSSTRPISRSADGKAKRPATLPNRVRTISHARNVLWVYDLSINLLTDLDFDGLYSSFSVSLDLDSSGYSQDVYAVMYLSQNGGGWQEYAVTSNFTVTGSSNHDRISIETELESGYYSGNYDHYIEIYDAHSHELVLTAGSEYGNQSHLPFESYTTDFGVSLHFNLSDDYSDNSYDSSVDVSLTLSGTGSIELATLIALLLLALYRCRQVAKHKADTQIPG